MLFFDRPGFGWSERGPGNNETPSAQANTIAALMDRLGIKKAIIVGHSFGGAVTTAFGREHPDKTLGLVFVSPGTHPWPGGATSWYYDLTTIPVIGWLFSETLTYPAGTLQMADATTCVFSPNKVPDDYVAAASIPLVLRPSGLPRQRHRCRRALSLCARRRAALPRDQGADRGHLGRPRQGGLRARSIRSASSATSPAPNWSGSTISATSRTGSRPTSSSAPSRRSPARTSTCRRWRKAVEARIAGDAYGAGKCADIKVPKPNSRRPERAH